MNNEQILKKAIEKAIKNGWGNAFQKKFNEYWDLDGEEAPYYLRAFGSGLQNLRYESIIFSHEFAEAFWGNWDKKTEPLIAETLEDLQPWQYHLRKMVLEKEPIKYLERFLNK